MGEIYLITGPTGKQYVGATKYTAEIRFKDHCRAAMKDGATRYLHNAIRKHGSKNFTVETLLVGSSDYVFSLEDQSIVLLCTRSLLGYNVVRGGLGGGDPTSEVRYRMGASNRGKKLSYASEWLKSYHRSNVGIPKYHANQSAVSRSAWSKPEHRAKMKRVLAKINSDPEIRKARSECMKAQRRDPEFNRRRDAALGKKVVSCME